MQLLHPSSTSALLWPGPGPAVCHDSSLSLSNLHLQYSTPAHDLQFFQPFLSLAPTRFYLNLIKISLRSLVSLHLLPHLLALPAFTHFLNQDPRALSAYLFIETPHQENPAAAPHPLLQLSKPPTPASQQSCSWWLSCVRFSFLSPYS